MHLSKLQRESEEDKALKLATKLKRRLQVLDADEASTESYEHEMEELRQLQQRLAES